MARPKMEIQRGRLSMRIAEHTMRFLRVRASVLGDSPNVYIEEAMKNLLEMTRDMKRIKTFGLVSNPAKAKRIPISIMIKKEVIEQVRTLAKCVDVPFAEVTEKAIAIMIHSDMDKIRAGQAGKLDCKVILEAYADYHNEEQRLSRNILAGYAKEAKEIEAKQQENPLK